MSNQDHLIDEKLEEADRILSEARSLDPVVLSMVLRLILDAIKVWRDSRKP